MTSPDTPPVRRKRPAKPQFAQTMLVLEALVVFFGTLVAFGLRAAEPRAVWLVGGVLTLWFLVIAGMVSRPGGYALGWAGQAMLVATTLVLPPVARPYALLMSVVFVVLWVVSLRIGARIDRERAEWDAAHPGMVGP
ncbi:DUF4233 domain-containing protein [Cellulomonas massiliensis]|uniref:DUF4233 domain-containing protein n=1 Tax=Cellulomonas massiliensis TaxID=1465811 RepID=UPI0002E791E6|nr:DUF4233 domain-containing protein [Cellulomonas massiliensis]